MMDPNAIPRPRTSVAAVASLVCGLLGCLIVPGVAAVILGIVGIAKTREPMVKGRGMAVAGLVLGSLGIIASIAAIALSLFAYFISETKLEPARLAAQRFIHDVSEGKVDAAVASSVAGTDRAPIADLAERMKPWGAFQGLDDEVISYVNAKGRVDYTIHGRARFATESRPCVIYVVEMGGTYRILGFNIK